MCGIGGILGPFEPSRLDAMGDAIAHRGPDGAGIWADQEAGIGFVHRRLSILDLSEHGAQPMWDADHRVVITYNGEIYNYPELKAQLVEKGHVFRSTCDTEVVVNGYKEWGPDVVRRLNGIFAFGLWDTTRRELLLARDAFGVKPLYYVALPRGIAFSSEIKALQAAGFGGTEVDLQAIAAYVTFLYSPGERTPLRDVRKLLPGHWLTVSADGRMRDEAYDDLPYDQPIEPLTEQEAIERTRYYLEQAVRRQLLSDVPVGAFLSGGLDSSAVVALAQRTSPRFPLECFTIGFGNAPANAEGMADDLPYARRVAAHLGVKLKVVDIEPPGTAELERMVWQLDEPQADPAALNTWFIAHQARACGYKVLLSGAGGDDIFTGYRRHRALQAERAWAWLPRRGRAALRALSERTNVRTALGRRLRKAFMYADADEAERLVGYFTWPPRGEAMRLLSADARTALGGQRPEQPLLDLIEHLPARTPPLNRMLALEQRFFLTDHNLNYTDKMSMAAGVETRVPLLDPELVAFAARLPVSFKQRGATGKWVFKRAMEGLLPQSVIYRPKTGFGAPLRTWLRSGFGALLDTYLAPEVIRRRGIFEADEVRRFVEKDRRGEIDAAYPLLALVCVEIWLRQHEGVRLNAIAPSTRAGG